MGNAESQEVCFQQHSRNKNNIHKVPEAKQVWFARMTAIKKIFEKFDTKNYVNDGTMIRDEELIRAGQLGICRKWMNTSGLVLLGYTWLLAFESEISKRSYYMWL